MMLVLALTVWFSLVVALPVYAYACLHLPNVEKRLATLLKYRECVCCRD